MTLKTRHCTALLIDDDEDDQFFFRRMIAQSGQIDNIISFEYADEALSFLKQTDREPINVIFLDIHMPRMNGFEFLEAATAELGSGFVKAVFVMVADTLDEASQERAASFEAVKGFIRKPPTAADIRTLFHRQAIHLEC